nr:E3 ubiquitin-protein ligase UHRF1-like [Leptinotarsa decemlineata]
MYIKIRKLGVLQNEGEKIVNISKMALIQELRSLIQKELGVKPEEQMLLYKGKQLIDDHKVMDYDIQLNDVVQLITKIAKSGTDSCEKDNTSVQNKADKNVTFVNAESKFYKVGDLIDVLLVDNGAWYEAFVYKILKKDSCQHNEEPNEEDLVFRVRNIKLVGRDRTPLENCSIKFTDEVMRIEKPELLADKADGNVHDECPRKYPYNCLKCKDVPDKKCRECGCRVCFGKDSCDTMILCDECDYGYHTSCLTPPLVSVPEDDEWYCPECKTDDSEIVKAGEKLKKSTKKAKMASNKGESSRDWGKGMACVGRTKECTLVSKDHYGPVPGVEVGTCWKFRLQVSEAGVHRPHVAGIHGRENDGAYSLVLSGGYEDDRDEGVEFFYTGSGGRDLSGNKRCGEQSCDQKLTRMNKWSLIEQNHWQKGKPVRVVRNYKGAKHSKYAPKDGNRYDGLYKVVQYFPERGKSGFIVWKYLLRRDDPVPAPWEKGGQELEMLYPPGYLEAQEAQEQKKDKENKSKSPDKSKRGSKRKIQDTSNTKPLTDFFNRTPKKSKSQEYHLPKEVTDFIQNDVENEKSWTECEAVLKEGKQKFLAKVEDVFMCICCQEVLLNPITTECKHNICKACLRRSFSSEIYTCPHCRHDLGKNYSMEVNNNLSGALKLLFPGYESAR